MVQRQPHTTSHKQTDAQTVSKQSLPPRKLSLLRFYCCHDVIWQGVSHWSVWVSCPSSRAAVKVMISTPARPSPSSNNWKITCDAVRREKPIQCHTLPFLTLCNLKKKSFFFFTKRFQWSEYQFVLGNCQQYFFVEDVLSRSILLQIWSHFF